MLEEIVDDDIDNMDFDPADFDPQQNVIGSSAYDSNTGARLVPKSATPTGSSSSTVQQDAFARLASAAASGVGATPRDIAPDGKTHFIQSESDMEQFKTWNVLYPCYFDANLTHTQGRRVGKALAVKNPQAQTIMQGLRELGIPAILEATKTHPRDWANTGRVRYLLKDEEITDLRKSEGMSVINNKRHLFRALAEYMQQHPTTKDTPFESPVFEQMQRAQGYRGERFCEPLAVPRGWKINEVLPVISPAITGGKAGEEMMEQMSQQMFPGMMGGAGGPGLPGAGGPGGNVPNVPKKVKRINIRK